MNDDLIYRLRKRAEIRRQIPTRKSVLEGQPDRIADLLEEAADTIERLRQEVKDFTISKPWVGLTNEEIDELWKTEYFHIVYELPRAIEAKLREKNT